MTTLLHIDTSARRRGSHEARHGSHTRRLSQLFVDQWRQHEPETEVLYRDIGSEPPGFVTEEWIHAAFTPESAREPWMIQTLRESDRLIDELIRADLIVMGVPMYNFGLSAQCKAYIDNIVRVGRTFGFDRARGKVPYWPMLSDMNKTLVWLTSSGDSGYARSQALSHMNHVEPALLTAMDYIGITRHMGTRVEYDEFGGEQLAASLEKAEANVRRMVASLTQSQRETMDL